LFLAAQKLLHDAKSEYGQFYLFPAQHWFFASRLLASRSDAVLGRLAPDLLRIRTKSSYVRSVIRSVTAQLVPYGNILSTWLAHTGAFLLTAFQTCQVNVQNSENMDNNTAEKS